MQVRFIIKGLRPAYSKLANDFLKVCDLGVEGAFVPDCAIITGNAATYTEEQLVTNCAKIKLGLEQQLGWRDVEVKGEIVP